MNVTFSDSFFKSLKKLRRDRYWYMRLYNYFRYDLKWFFKNLYSYRKALVAFRPWNGDQCLIFLKISLEKILYQLEKYGHEEETSLNKKIIKIKRAIEILNHKLKDNYIELAENELGELPNTDFSFVPCKDNPDFCEMVDNDTEEEAKHRTAVYDLSHKLEQDEWNELWDILKGQAHNDWKPSSEDLTFEEKDKEYWDWIDGTGINSWWD